MGGSFLYMQAPSPPLKRRKLSNGSDAPVEKPSTTNSTNPSSGIVTRYTYSSSDGTLTEKKPRETLESSTTKVLNYLQTVGSATFKEINENTDVSYRRTSDILNILKQTPLIEKTGPKKEDPFVFCGDIKLDEPIDVRTIIQDIETEKETIKKLKQKLNEA